MDDSDYGHGPVHLCRAGFQGTRAEEYRVARHRVRFSVSHRFLNSRHGHGDHFVSTKPVIDMPVFVAMLRGVNVGKNPIKMEHLRAVFEQLGFSNIKTYIQSGNIVFSTPRSSATDSLKVIESKLKAESGVQVRAILKTPAEMKKIVRANPFVKDKKLDQSKL